ncbi:HD domain-containing protein [Solitalea canadensis]|uniref:HD superfamily phosphohydrolase n=1 Tax=Solitalea canadensis (strain ATCC 29591 / DSM 3403 / JCM 21819 / LMG 8368 / NBRC 15130 / NCIMB 12057 / USAM 9D) TaxID=929556 RepID=H8KQH5_SOLCM|nr:HD domain-containing protein [Solitalea canadensis]AFD06591.1 HD superfamily phosphohydrolase [Solitalea canadensis DSM 3403]
MLYLDTIYGEIEIEKLLSSLINTKPFQRLKNIHQGGAIIIANSALNNTRFEHSIGVMILIKKLGGSIEEQIAGLLHDISHTAFSHLIDYVLELDDENYHERIYSDVVSHSEIKILLTEHNLSIETFLDLEKFTILEYPLPSLCADRIDYALRDLYKLELISKEDINWFLEGLTLSSNRIVLKDLKYAKWFKEKYTYLVEEYFNGKQNSESNQFMKSLIRNYYDAQLITKEDFDKDDFYLLSKIEKLANENIYEMYNNWLAKDTDKQPLKTKKRIIDPEILLGQQIVKLSQIEQ